MKRLISGVLDYRKRVYPEYKERLAALASGQAPDALFITCADSRVEPSLFASTDPGQLFMMRNVGNLVPPAHPDGRSVGDESEAAALEYAVRALEVDDIVVCGHSSCGAMKAVYDREVPPGLPNLEAWLRHAEPALETLRNNGPLDSSLSPYDQLSQQSVLEQLAHIETYPIVMEQVQQGLLRLHAMWFDIGTGALLLFDRALTRFIPIDGEYGQSLLDRLTVLHPHGA